MERTEVQFIPTKFGYCETQTCKTKGEFFVGRPDCSIGNHRVLCSKCVKELIKSAVTIGYDENDDPKLRELKISVMEEVEADLEQKIEQIDAAGATQSNDTDDPKGTVTPEPENSADDLETKEAVEKESADVLEKLDRDELYEYAKQFDIDGRSKMNKDELIEALLGYAEENDIAFAGVQEE